MRPFSSTCLAAILLLVSSAAVADVQVVTRRDGTKYVTNLGTMPGRGARSAGSHSDLLWLSKQRNRSSEYDAAIDKWSDRFGVDPIMVRAVIQVESNFRPGVVSSKGARGLMQLMPGTAKRFGVKTIDDPEQNIRGGVAYLATLLRLFPNDLTRVFAAYNAGENAVLRYGRIPPYAETQTYVKRCMSVYYGKPYGGIHLTTPLGEKLRGKLGSGMRPTNFAGAARPALRTAARSVAVVR